MFSARAAPIISTVWTHKNGVLYGTTDQGLVTMDAATGALQKSWPLANASAVKVRDSKTAYVISGNEIRRIDPTTGISQIFLAGLTNPRSLTIDAKNRVWVSLGEPVHQVVVYSAEGKELGRVGEAGGRGIGPWQTQRMLLPTGIALDPQGKLWVMEHDDTPKRVSVWDISKLAAPRRQSVGQRVFRPDALRRFGRRDQSARPKFDDRRRRGMAPRSQNRQIGVSGHF